MSVRRDSVDALEAASPLMNLPALLTVREVAAYLGVHDKTVYAWVERGSIPHYKIGGRVRFDIAQVQQWLCSRRGGV